MSRPTTIERNSLAQAIRIFRSALGDNQRQFAARTGLALTSIARYETNAKPNPQVLERFAGIAREAKLLFFSEIFEGRLAPEDAELDQLQFSAIKCMLERLWARLGIDPNDLRRARLLLSVSLQPNSHLSKLEDALGQTLSATFEDSISHTAGAIVRGRNLEVETAHIAYLQNRTPETAIKYITAFDQNPGKASKGIDPLEPEDTPFFYLGHFRKKPNQMAEIILGMIERNKELREFVRNKL
jgi:transcriptional regulator with XRE-family HTH domain